RVFGVVALALQRVVDVRELVGDDKCGEQQQPGLSDLTNSSDEFGNLRVDVLRKTPDADLLPVITGDLIGPAVHRHTDLAHISPLRLLLSYPSTPERRASRAPAGVQEF